MRDLFRILFLAAIIIGGIWFYQSRQLDEPDEQSPYTFDSLEENGEQDYEERENDGEPGWSREERAIWRDGVNRRLMR